MIWQAFRSSIRLPLHRFRPSAAQNRQIACCSGREFWVEGAGVNSTGNGSDDLGAATSGVAGSAIDVARAATFQNAGAVQKIVHEGIDGHHGLAGLEPDGPLATRPYQQAG